MLRRASESLPEWDYTSEFRVNVPQNMSDANHAEFFMFYTCKSSQAHDGTTGKRLHMGATTMVIERFTITDSRSQSLERKSRLKCTLTCTETSVTMSKTTINKPNRTATRLQTDSLHYAICTNNNLYTENIALGALPCKTNAKILECKQHGEAAGLL